MALNNFGSGVFGHGCLPKMIKARTYDWSQSYPCTKIEKDVFLIDIMVRSTGRTAYYIIKYLENGTQKRKNGITYFHVYDGDDGDKLVPLKSYLKKIGVDLCL